MYCECCGTKVPSLHYVAKRGETGYRACSTCLKNNSTPDTSKKLTTEKIFNKDFIKK